MISSKVIEPSPLRTSSKSSKSVLTKSNSSTSSTSSSKRKEIQFPQSSLSALEDKDTYIKRRPRSHSNPTTAVKKGDSSYSPKDRLRASGAENTSSHNSKDRSTSVWNGKQTSAVQSEIRLAKTENESSLRRSSSLRSSSSIKSSSSIRSSASVKSISSVKNISSVKSYPSVKHSRSATPKAEHSSQAVNGITSSKEKERETKNKNNRKPSLRAHLKAFSSVIMNGSSSTLIEPVAGSKKYMPIESTPTEQQSSSSSSSSKNMLYTSSSKPQKSEHSSISKTSGGISSSGTFSTASSTNQHHEIKQKDESNFTSSSSRRQKRESELSKSGEGGSYGHADEGIVRSKRKEEKRGSGTRVMNGVTTHDVTTQQPTSSKDLSGGSTSGAQLTTEEQQPLLLPANKVVSTGVCRWFRCCPITSPSLHKSSHSGSNRSVSMPPEM